MNHITIKQRGALAALLALGLSACSGSGTNPVASTKANLAANTLQFAVGTANVQGTAGLNVVATYRQNAGGVNPGASAVLVSSPTLSGPFTLAGAAGTPDGFGSTIVTGPAPAEIGGHAMTSTGQTATNVTTFGQSGGVFGLGIEPWNYNEGGSPDGVAPYPVPLYDALSGAAAGDPNQFVPWGGPPAFDPNGDGEGTRDGNVYPGGTLGISEGLDVFDLAPVGGSYSLAVAVPSTTGGGITATANATLGSTTLLSATTAPVPVEDGNGGATFTVTMPADETEAYLQIVDIGPETGDAGCHAGADPVYYTIEVHGSGTYTLGDKSGPLGEPSICTSAQNTAANAAAGGGPAAIDGDEFTVQYVGFDYPAYEMSYPNSLHNPAPTILGAKGQDDISISAAATYKTTPAGAAPAAQHRSLVKPTTRSRH